MLPNGFREVRCPLLGLKDATRLLLIGDPNAALIVYFQAGYPDNQTAFVSFARRLAEEADCLCGLGCMPEFDTDGKTALLKPSGYSFSETAQCFKQAVVTLRQESSNPAAALVLCIHDWGVAPGIMFTNRMLSSKNEGGNLRPSKLVVFDVLPSPRGHLMTAGYSCYALFVHLFYRGFFAISFLLSRASIALATFFFSIGAALIFGLFGCCLNPTSKLDGKQGGSVKSMRALPRMCYPYYHMFYEMILGGALVKEFVLPPLDQVQMLYVYGKSKNTMFHTSAGLAALEVASGSSYIGLENAGHWCYLHDETECLKLVKGFLLQ